MSLYWTGIRAWEAQCLLPWLSVEYGITLEATRASFPCRSVEAQIGRRALWGSGDAGILDPMISSFIAGREKSTPATFASYSPVATASSLAKIYLWAVPGHLLALWNDKIQSGRWMRSKGLPAIPFVPFKGGKFPNDEKMLVMQLPHGSCGAQTYIGNPNALEALHRSIGHPHVRLIPFIDGYIINSHVFIMPNGESSAGIPSLQLVLPNMTGKVCQPLYAGNDFAAYEEIIPPKIRKIILQLLKKLGICAAQEGYHGVLGADLIYNPADSSVCFLEINPRMQGSTGLLSMIEASDGRIPSAALFFMSFMDSMAEQMMEETDCLNNTAPLSAQFILRQGIKTDFSRYCQKSELVDESPSMNIEFLATTHRYLTNFSRPTIHHDRMGNILKWAEKNDNCEF